MNVLTRSTIVTTAVIDLRIFRSDESVTGNFNNARLFPFCHFSDRCTLLRVLPSISRRAFSDSVALSMKTFGVRCRVLVPADGAHVFPYVSGHHGNCCRIDDWVVRTYRDGRLECYCYIA